MEEKKKYTIGILSDSPFICTGYSNIATNIANILSDAGHNVIFLGNNFWGQMLMPGIKFEDGKELKFKVLGMAKEMYFRDVLSTYTKLYKMDVLIILLDTFMMYPWFMDLDLSPAKVVFYYPSDGGGGMPLGCENILKKVDVPVAMAKFGQRQVEDLHGVKSRYIPHAVDTNYFYPLKKEEKEKLKEFSGLKGKFVIGVVARNQGRKMLDRTIKIMSLYSKYDKDAVMMMHLDPEDVAQVFPIVSLVNRYGLQNRIFFTGMKYYKGFNFKQMNNVYNTMDVFLLTTSGEGFGVPIIEAMACEVPVVVTDYTTTKELVLDNNCGLGINLAGVSEEKNPDVHGNEILDGTLTGNWSVERGMCSIEDGVKKLIMLKEDKELRERMGKNGREAVLKYYDWKGVGQQWIDLVEELGGKI